MPITIKPASSLFAEERCSVCGIYAVVVTYRGKKLCNYCYCADRGWEAAGEKPLDNLSQK